MINRTLGSRLQWTRNDQDVITHLAPWFWNYFHVGVMTQLGNPRTWKTAVAGGDWAHLLSNISKNIAKE
jgi:hypothetical protein